MGERAQENIWIHNIEIPIIIKDGRRYYPVRYLTNKVLKRDNARLLIDKIPREKVYMFEVKFGESNIQMTYCAAEEEIREALIKLRTVNLSPHLRESQNMLHKHFDLPLLEVSQSDFKKYKREWIKMGNYATLIAITNELSLIPNAPARKCKECELILPLTDIFFSTSKGSFFWTCRWCSGIRKRKSEDTYMRFKTGDAYVDHLSTNMSRREIDHKKIDRALRSYMKGSYLHLYDLLLRNKIDKMPESFYTKEWFMKALVHVENNKKYGNIKLKDMASKEYRDRFKLKSARFGHIKIYDMYKTLYKEDFLYEMWKYPHFQFRDIELTAEIAIRNFNGYLKEFNICIDDPINFDYDSILRKCYLRGVYEKIGGVCGFFVEYWNGKYAGYEFRNVGNYYRHDRNNVIRDLKHLVEKVYELPVEKIPLYITKNVLMKEANSLYRHIITKGNGNLYTWFNEIYPNRFLEEDFIIGNYRNDFDSIEEEQVDGVLREFFKNVVYNHNTSNQVVELKGKIPDWFIFTERGVWLVEYFGMYLKDQEYNPIIKDYIETAHQKINLYNEMTGYNFLLVYPEDIEKDFKGLRDKIEKIKEKHKIL